MKSSFQLVSYFGNSSPFFNSYFFELILSPSLIVFVIYFAPLGNVYSSVISYNAFPSLTVFLVLTVFLLYTPLLLVYTVDVLTASPFSIFPKSYSTSIILSNLFLQVLLTIGLNISSSSGKSIHLCPKKSSNMLCALTGSI